MLLLLLVFLFAFNNDSSNDNNSVHFANFSDVVSTRDIACDVVIGHHVILLMLLLIDFNNDR